ncbi:MULTISPECIES: hypothetical protein [unclassified Corynebacterium]|nr:MULTISPECIES: hypothetical protein [unclassified Corynebacterium]MDK8898411.1 hypothetical protein [Corynebacterium sp. MSK004]
MALLIRPDLSQVRKDSQLIANTDQKPTVDVATVLYGFTMRGVEPSR